MRGDRKAYRGGTGFPVSNSLPNVKKPPIPKNGGTGTHTAQKAKENPNQSFDPIRVSMRKTGLEPVWESPHAPQTCASASSATSAWLCVGVFTVRVFVLPTGDIIAHPFPFVNRIFKKICENRKKSASHENRRLRGGGITAVFRERLDYSTTSSIVAMYFASAVSAFLRTFSSFETITSGSFKLNIVERVEPQSNTMPRS